MVKRLTKLHERANVRVEIGIREVQMGSVGTKNQSEAVSRYE